MNSFAHAGAVRARARRAGFTLIEILIALVVLAVALLGVLALLVASTRMAADVVEDAFAATTARSVYEATRISARERGFAVEEGGAVVRGFILAERGVVETVPAPGAPTPASSAPPPLPTDPKDSSKLTALRASDQVVFLPRRAATGVTDPIFVFPRPQGAATGNGTSHDDSFTGSNVVTNDQGVAVTLDFKRAYPLAAPPDPATPTPTGLSGPPVSREMSDQYSWALVVRCAPAPIVSNPSNPGEALNWPSKQFLPDASARQDGLYEVQVLVFRNFDPDSRRRNNQPVSGGRFGGLIAVGP